MILRPFRRSAANRTIASLYGTIVAQARCPAFYAKYGVPDTLQGRFDLLVLHLVLVLRRLRAEEPRRKSAAGNLGQRLFDTFCRDLDGNLREMGIGDLAVPKHMRRFAEAFYGRQAAYLAALARPGQRDFENAVARNILGANAGDDSANRLACYARAVVHELDAHEESALIRGEVAFPRPEAFADVSA
jgi:cytochrome b pre-mRNA-processing protein 3